MPEKGAGAPSSAIRISLALHQGLATASPIYSLYIDAGHYALKVENDCLTRRRGSRGEKPGA